MCQTFFGIYFCQSVFGSMSFCHADTLKSVFYKCFCHWDCKVCKIIFNFIRFLDFIMKKLFTLCFFAVTLIFSTAQARSLDVESVAPHPRLMLHKGDITAMRAMHAVSASGRVAHNRIIARAESLIEQPEVSYPLSITPQEVMERVFYLSYAYLTSDDMRYARRAEQEMLAVSAFRDWNPTTHADAATLTLALAIGYDWLYRALPIHSRSIIGTAIYEKGLRPMDGITSKDSIVHLGLMFGALAIIERAPEYCKSLASNSVVAFESLMTEQNRELASLNKRDRELALLAMYSQTLSSALNQKISSVFMKELADVSHVMDFMVAPSMQYYNYGGASAQAHVVAAKYWMATQQREPSLVAVDEQLAANGHFVEDFTLPLYMLFASMGDFSKAKLSDDTMWHNEEFAIYREGWNKKDTYLAIKGGDGSSAGEYIFEKDGVRWVSLTGGVDGRLVVDGERGDVNGTAHVQDVYEVSRRYSATVDLSALYSSRTLRVKRTIELAKGDRLYVTDNLVCGSHPATIEWSITTSADAEVVDANTIRLTHSGQTLYLKVRSRAQAVAKVWPDKEGMSRVGFILTAAARSEQSIEVSFTSDASKRSVTLPRLNIRRNR